MLGAVISQTFRRVARPSGSLLCKRLMPPRRSRSRMARACSRGSPLTISHKIWVVKKAEQNQPNRAEILNSIQIKSLEDKRSAAAGHQRSGRHSARSAASARSGACEPRNGSDRQASRAARDDDAIDELVQLEARSLGIAGRKRFLPSQPLILAISAQATRKRVLPFRFLPFREDGSSRSH